MIPPQLGYSVCGVFDYHLQIINVPEGLIRWRVCFLCSIGSAQVFLPTSDSLRLGVPPFTNQCIDILEGIFDPFNVVPLVHIVDQFCDSQSVPLPHHIAGRPLLQCHQLKLCGLQKPSPWRGRWAAQRVGRGVPTGIRSSIGIDERGVTGTPLQSASQTASPQGEAFWARRQVFFP